MQQKLKTTILKKLIRKRLLNEQEQTNRNTQARSEEEISQIQNSLREHNRGKENNRQHEKHENKHERGTTTARTKQGNPHNIVWIVVCNSIYIYIYIYNTEHYNSQNKHIIYNSSNL